MSPAVRVALLLLAAISHRIATNPPHPPPTDADRLYNKKNFFERFGIRFIPAIVQVVGITCILMECTALLAMQYLRHSQALQRLCVNLSPSFATTPLLICGVGLVYTAVLVRLWCYQALGSFFTFELTIRPNHKLITSGPYAIVRHLSYAAIVLVNIGMIMAVLGPGSYVRECHILSTPAGGILIGRLVLLAYGTLQLVGRGRVEDEGLRKEFGALFDLASGDCARCILYEALSTAELAVVAQSCTGASMWAPD